MLAFSDLFMANSWGAASSTAGVRGAARSALNQGAERGVPQPGSSNGQGQAGRAMTGSGLSGDCIWTSTSGGAGDVEAAWAAGRAGDSDGNTASARQGRKTKSFGVGQVGVAAAQYESPGPPSPAVTLDEEMDDGTEFAAAADEDDGTEFAAAADEDDGSCVYAEAEDGGEASNGEDPASGDDDAESGVEGEGEGRWHQTRLRERQQRPTVFKFKTFREEGGFGLDALLNRRALNPAEAAADLAQGDGNSDDELVAEQAKKGAGGRRVDKKKK